MLLALHCGDVAHPAWGLQVASDPLQAVGEGASQDRYVLRGKVEERHAPAAHRVLISHEELCLLVVRPSVGVTAPPGAALSFPRRR